MQNVLLPIVQLQLSATGQITPVYAAAAASNLLFLSPVSLVPLLQPRMLPAAAPLHAASPHTAMFTSARLQQRGAYDSTRRSHQRIAAQQMAAAQLAAAAAAKQAQACAHARPAGLACSDVGGLSAEFIERCFMDLQQWEGFENGLVSNMRACGWCGKAAFGGIHSMLWKHMSLKQCEEIPAAVAANPRVLYTAAEAADGSKGFASPCPGKYYCCQTCQKHDARVARQLYHMRTSAGDMQAMQTLYQLNAGEQIPSDVLVLAPL